MTSEDRLAGYLAAHRRAGIAVDPTLMLRGEYEQATAFDSVRDAVARPERPTALLSFSNMMTLGALQAMRALGLEVPRDVSIVGMDDFEFAELLNPPPTVVRVPLAQMAQRAIAVLLSEIASRAPPTGQVEVFEAELVARASTREIAV